jgi:hypothetical protein
LTYDLRTFTCQQLTYSIRVYAQNHLYAIFYAIRQLAYTP